MKRRNQNIMKSRAGKIGFFSSFIGKCGILFLIILCLFTGSIAAVYFYSRNYLEQEFDSDSEILTSQISENIASRLETVEKKYFSAPDLMKQFGTILNGLNRCESGSSQAMRYYMQLSNALEERFSITADTLWMGLVDLNDNVYTNNTARRLHIQDSYIIQLVKENHEALRSNYGTGVWIRGEDNTLIFMRAVFNESTLHFCGYAVACVYNRILNPVFDDLDTESIGNFVVYDWSHSPVYTTEILEKGQQPLLYLQQEEASSGYRARMVRIPYSGLKLVHYINLEKKNQRYYGFFRISVLVGLLTSMLVLLFFYGIFSGTADNIERVLEQMKHIAQGNFDIKSRVYTKDEVGVIAEGVNQMSDQIQTLLSQVAEAEEARQKSHYQILQARYHALQAQINPHFLYNVLESINGIAQINKDTEVSDLICSLAAFFRSNIDRTEKLCLLKEELEYLDNYLKLYQSIYQERLQLQYDIEPECQMVQIPTFLLQPILENSLVHGMENKIGPCTVSLKAFREENTLKLVIHDDGVGMSKQRLAVVRTFAYETGKQRVGLCNVQQRIQLLYGMDYGVKIDSAEEQYTEVVLTIPWEKR